MRAGPKHNSISKSHAWLRLLPVVLMAGIAAAITGGCVPTPSVMTSNGTLQILPVDQTVSPGTQVPYTLLFTDAKSNVTLTVTNNAVWSSSDTNVATISTNSNPRGVATAGSPGQTTINATYMGITVSTTLTVSANAPPPTISTAGPTDGITGQPYSVSYACQDGGGGTNCTLLETTGGLGSGGCSGLSATSTANSLTVSGTASSAETCTYVIEARDQAGQTSSLNQIINIYDSLDILDTDEQCGVGVACSEPLTLAGGNGTFACSEVGNNGTVTVTPQCALTANPGAGSGGVVAVNVQATSPTNPPQTTTKTVNVNIAEITTASPLPDAIVGQSYAQGLTLANFSAFASGTPGWFIPPGTEPPGTTLGSSSGGFGGVPLLAGTYNFTVNVLNSSLAVVTTKDFQVTVLPGLSVAPASASVAEGGQQQFTAIAVSDLSQPTNGPDVTTLVNWSSSDTSIATISNLGGSEGLATGVMASQSPATITASLATGASATATLTVNPAPPPPGPAIAYLYTADGNGDTVSIFSLDVSATPTLIGSALLGGTGTTGVAVDPNGDVLAATFQDGTLALATANADGSLTPFPGPAINLGAPATDPEFFFDGANLFLYVVLGGNQIDGYKVDTQNLTTQRVPGAPAATNGPVKDLQVNSAHGDLEVVPAAGAPQSFVVAHILDVTGTIQAPQQTVFDTTIFSEYHAGVSGVNALAATSTDVELFLFDQNSGLPTSSGGGAQPCASCQNAAFTEGGLCVSLDSQPPGQPTTKKIFSVDNLLRTLSPTASVPSNVALGYAIVVVAGDASNTNITSAVVNTASGSFDLGVFAFDPPVLGGVVNGASKGGGRPVQGAPGAQVLPACTMTGTPTFVSTAGGGAVDVAYKRVNPLPVNQPPTAAFTFNVLTSTSVAFDANGTMDPDGIIAGLFWDSDGDSLFDASGVTPTFNFPGPGTYDVTLRVVDNRGASDTLTQQVTIPMAGPTLTNINVTPNPSNVASGLNLQLTATGIFSDGSMMDVTSTATWSTANPSIATVNGTGLVQGEIGAAGLSTTISATVGLVTGTSTVNVTNAVLTMVAVTPDPISIPVGVPQQFTATGTFSDGSNQVVTNSCTWSTGDNLIATVDSAGLATAQGVGMTLITAECAGVIGAATVTVTNAAIQFVTISPQAPSVPVGVDVQLTATGTFTDGSMQDITSTANWASSNSSVATVNATGLVHGAGAGMTTISATQSGITGTATTTVTSAVLISVQVNPNPASIPLGFTQQFTATGVFSDGTNQNVTNTCTWSSGDNLIATVDNAGLATAQGVGMTPITADCGGVSDVATFTVTNPVLQSLAISPAPVPLAVGLDLQLTAIGTFSDGSMQDVTNTATWSSSDTNLVTVSATGLAHGVAAGSAMITAAIGAVNDVVSVNVFPPLADVDLQAFLFPSSTSVDPFTNLSFDFGLFNNSNADAFGVQVVLTLTDCPLSSFTTPTGWTATQNGNVVTFLRPQLNAFFGDNFTAFCQTSLGPSSAIADVVVSALNPDPNSADNQTMVTISNSTLVGLTVTPANPSIASGTKIQLTATGAFSSGNNFDFTTQATWSSSNTAVASVSSTGLVSALSQGATDVTATVSTLSDTVALTVTPAVQNLAVTAVGSGTQTGPLLPYIVLVTVEAMNGSFTGSQLDLQASAGAVISSVTPVSGAVAGCTAPPFTQGNSSTCTFDASPGNDVVVQVSMFTDNGTAGTTQSLTATASDPADLNAPDDTFVLPIQVLSGSSIVVTPTAFTAVVGEGDVQLTATARAGGMPLYDITDVVTWTSFNPTVASVDDMSSKGLVTAHQAGFANISAGNQFIQGFANATVHQNVRLDVSPGYVRPGVSSPDLQYTATRVLENGSAGADITSLAVWSSTNPSVATVQTAGDPAPGLVDFLAQGTTTIQVSDPQTGLMSQALVDVDATQQPQEFLVGSNPQGLSVYNVDPATGTPRYVLTDRAPDLTNGDAIATDGSNIFSGHFVLNPPGGRLAKHSVDTSTGLLTRLDTYPMSEAPGWIAASSSCVAATEPSAGNVHQFSRSGLLAPTDILNLPGVFPFKVAYSPSADVLYACDGEILHFLNENPVACSATDSGTTVVYPNRRDFDVSFDGKALYILTVDFNSFTSNIIIELIGANGFPSGTQVSVPLPSAGFAIFAHPTLPVAYILTFDGNLIKVDVDHTTGIPTVGAPFPVGNMDSVFLPLNRLLLYYTQFSPAGLCRQTRDVSGNLVGALSCTAAPAGSPPDRRLVSVP